MFQNPKAKLKDLQYSEQLKAYCKSTILRRRVTYKLFMPSGTSGVSYPLLLLNDGQESSAVKIHKTLEELSESGLMKPVIVVAVYAGDRMHEYGIASQADYAGRGSLASDYTQFMMREFIPFLSSKLPVGTDNRPHAIAGYSLGALSAFDIAWNNPDYFGIVGCFSGSFWWRTRAWKKGRNVERFRIAHNMVRAADKVPGTLKFWFQAGTDDETNDRNGNGIIDSIDDTLDLIKELNIRGIDGHRIRYLEIAGGRHHPDTWAEAMKDFLMWAFPPEHQ